MATSCRLATAAALLQAPGVSNLVSQAGCMSACVVMSISRWPAPNVLLGQTKVLRPGLVLLVYALMSQTGVQLKRRIVHLSHTQPALSSANQGSPEATLKKLNKDSGHGADVLDTITMYCRN